MPSYQLIGLDPSPFMPLFALPDAALRERGARRVLATSEHGFPCRVSLQDARIGEELLLLPHVHQPAASPYRASGPIYVRRDAARGRLPTGTVNDYVTRRLLSVRAYDREHMMCAAEVVEGSSIQGTLARLFDSSETAYVHLHNAKHGCFFCHVARVD